MVPRSARRPADAKIAMPVADSGGRTQCSASTWRGPAYQSEAGDQAEPVTVRVAVTRMIGGIMRRGCCVTLVTIAGTGLIAGCGSSPATGTPPGAPRTTATTLIVAAADQPGLEAAVRAYSQAYLGGQGSAAYGLLSQRCQARISATDMEALTAAAQAQYGPEPITTLTVNTHVDTLARVSYTYPDPAINQREEPWVFENDAWHQDDC